ncbi:hypothetical protein BJP27_24365 (plasmid) [Pseudomonas oryzihabitans]|nr:hypothetical protein BJP27_24365 [Pseudomonas psychrotolerans]
MRSPETCECRYSAETEDLVWCLGCREAEKARKGTPRPGRFARLRAWLSEPQPEKNRAVIGPAQVVVAAGSPITVMGVRAHLVEPAQLFAYPCEAKALKAMGRGRSRWKVLAARLVYSTLALGFLANIALYAYEAWQTQHVASSVVSAAWFYAVLTYATLRKARHPFRPVLLRVW